MAVKETYSQIVLGGNGGTVVEKEDEDPCEHASTDASTDDELVMDLSITSGSGTLCVFGCHSVPGLLFLCVFTPLLDYFGLFFV